MSEAAVGVDIVEIQRMERILSKTPSFAQRMFTEEERVYCESSSRPAAHYACRFAAREAVLKALGTGFGKGVGRKDVSVSRDQNGKPIAVLSGGALKAAQSRGIVEVAISLSFTSELAVANAMAITEDAKPRPKTEKKSEREVIAETFRNARAVLDELDRMQDDELIAVTGLSATSEWGSIYEARSEH